MRYLNKVVFINSAAIKYAEILLDGNVHLIGTQGVGKSTILRSVLFFYNADSLKLGIAKEKKNYQEYYLPYTDSYIVYEVKSEDSAFCVMTFRSQGRVGFRFIDSPFRKEIFINEDNVAYNDWWQIKSVLDKLDIFYSHKLDTLEEYRDILYGNYVARKEYKRFALLESAQYQNIPRTIQNVFLNSKLEAEFIKQTIILSLEDEDKQIRLDNYKHHLKDFDIHLRDIKTFRDKAVTMQAEEVTRYRAEIGAMRMDEKEMAYRLAWAVDSNKNRLPKLEKEVLVLKHEEEKTNRRIDEITARSGNALGKIKGRLSVVDSKIHEARQKEQVYKEQDIESICKRIEQKSVVMQEQTHLKNERDLLQTEFKSVSQKYEALLGELENQKSAFENENQKARLQIQSEQNEQRERMRKECDKLIEESAEQHNDMLKLAEQELNEKREKQQQAQIAKANAGHVRHFEKEIEALKDQISEHKNRSLQAKNGIDHARRQADMLQKQWDNEQRMLEKETKREKERLTESIEQLKPQVAAIDRKLESTHDSFYGWLNDNVPGWEHSIGKVCDEQVLFRKDLAPKLAAEALTNNFFGLEIEMESLEQKVKSATDYAREKQAIQDKIEALRSAFDETDKRFAAEEEALRNKFRPQVRDLKEQVRVEEYQLEQAERLVREKSVELEDLRRNAQSKQQEQLEEVSKAAELARKEVEAATNKLEGVRKAIKEQSKHIEHDLRRKSEELQAQSTTRIAELKEALDQYLVKYATRKKELENEKLSDLSGSGANVDRIDAIAKQLKKLEQELAFIEENTELVVIYKKDKQDLIDRLPDFRNEKKLYEQKISQEAEAFRLKKDVLVAQLEQTKLKLSECTAQIKSIQEDAKEYERFATYECYQEMKEWLVELRSGFETEDAPKVLIAKLMDKHYALERKVTDLKAAVAKFLGNFSERNLFSFRTNLMYDADFIDFAAELADFVEEDKITKFEEEVYSRFASIIQLIGKETDELTSREGEIQSIISRINRDFDEKRDVGSGIIRKIELRRDDSMNPVVSILKEIKGFNDEFTHSLGEANLFGAPNKLEVNAKAIDYLRILSKEIDKYKKECISLSDSFELKFRVVENTNDTGWVEKLSNVGSEGTDILVKAMINIMLLNVFKENVSNRFKDFKLHCMMDEIGKLHPNNIKGILRFANDRNILLINGSPTENNPLAYKHIFKLEKDANSVTRIKRLLTNYEEN